IGPRSTPDYASLADSAVSDLGNGVRTFAGQRGEGFYVDLGSIFDLGALRPFQNLHLIPLPAAPGVNGTKGFNVHTIALSVPKTDVTRGGFDPTDPADPRSVIGVWSAARRRKALVREKNGRLVETGPWVQVSRLGEPLINEVVIELGEKDRWNSRPPNRDDRFLDDYAHPQLQSLLPILYPGVFPNLAALTAAGASRADLIAILLTGIPSGIIPGFQNSNGPTQADELRLNLAFAPTYAATDPGINPPGDSAKRFGLLGGDLDGFPNGRRVFDNVTAVELRAIAGVTYPLIDSGFTPDGAASLLADGTKEDLPFVTLGVDVDLERLALVEVGRAPIHEPGLERPLKTAILSGRLRVSDEIADVAETDVIFLTVGTPSRLEGSIDTSHVERASREVGAALRSQHDDRLVVVKSTVIPGTTRSVVKPLLEESSGKRVGAELGLCTNPEFLKEGSAIEDTF